MIEENESLDEYLFDIQAVGGIPGQERIIELLSKLLVGGVAVCYTISEIAFEFRRYRTNKR